jgi:hypothetical protein
MWEQFFIDLFDYSAESLGTVIYAWGCREGWLQGELYRAGWRRGLRVNEFSLGGNKKADLCCRETPRMVAEIKILGGDYESKGRWALHADVERLRAVADGDLEKYKLLIIPESEGSSLLGDYLHGVCYSKRCVDKEYPAFRLRLWRLDDEIVPMTPKKRRALEAAGWRI